MSNDKRRWVFLKKRNSIFFILGSLNVNECSGSSTKCIVDSISNLVVRSNLAIYDFLRISYDASETWNELATVKFT